MGFVLEMQVLMNQHHNTWRNDYFMLPKCNGKKLLLHNYLLFVVQQLKMGNRLKEAGYYTSNGRTVK